MCGEDRFPARVAFRRPFHNNNNNMYYTANEIFNFCPPGVVSCRPSVLPKIMYAIVFLESYFPSASISPVNEHRQMNKCNHATTILSVEVLTIAP